MSDDIFTTDFGIQLFFFFTKVLYTTLNSNQYYNYRNLLTTQYIQNLNLKKYKKYTLT